MRAPERPDGAPDGPPTSAKLSPIECAELSQCRAALNDPAVREKLWALMHRAQLRQGDPTEIARREVLHYQETQPEIIAQQLARATFTVDEATPAASTRRCSMLCWLLERHAAKESAARKRASRSRRRASPIRRRSSPSAAAATRPAPSAASRATSFRTSTRSKKRLSAAEALALPCCRRSWQWLNPHPIRSVRHGTAVAGRAGSGRPAALTWRAPTCTTLTGSGTRPGCDLAWGDVYHQRGARPCVLRRASASVFAPRDASTAPRTPVQNTRRAAVHSRRVPCAVCPPHRTRRRRPDKARAREQHPPPVR